MKKLIIPFLLIALCFVMIGCNQTVKFDVNFIVDGEIYRTVGTSGNETIMIPENPTKDGYTFDGWYWDDGEWQKPFTANSLLEVPLSSDMNVYAKWLDNNSNALPEGSSTDIDSSVLNIDGDHASLVVPNATETFSFLNDIVVAKNASYILAKDIGCENVIASKTVALSEGDNTYYLLVSNGSAQKLYTITIRRKPIYTVTFDTVGGSSVAQQHIEEGFLASPVETSRTGYTFIEWDYDFTTPITQNIVIHASWTPNTSTAYVVEYYLENLSKNGYELTTAENLAGVTDSIATAEIKDIEHFTYVPELSTISGEITADGNLVLKVFYSRNVYTVTTSSYYGSITEGGSYPYGTQITINVTWEDGYTYVDLHDELQKLTTEPSYTFVVRKDTQITAHINVNEQTPYVVEYYLQNISLNGYDKVSSETLYGKTDTQAIADVKKFDHFTHAPLDSNTTGYIKGDGTLILKVYYTRNKYKIQTSINLGNITAGGTYPYGTEITINASFAAGYYFNGFFENKERVCEESSYTFIVDSNRTISGSVKVCEDTPYNVEYFIANLNQTGYELYRTITYTGTTDSITSAPLIDIEGFTYDSGNSYKQITGDGLLVFKVYYSRNTYKVSKESSDYGKINTSGNFKYGTEIELKATPILGYEIDEWFVDGKSVSKEETYKLIVTKNITVSVSYKLKDEMSYFVFTSTSDTCTINGVINKEISEIIVPNYVTRIDVGAFSGCSNLTKLTIPFVGTSADKYYNSEAVFGAIFGTKSFEKSAYTEQRYSNSGTVEYYIPSALKQVVVTGSSSISYGAFGNCIFLKSVIFEGEYTQLEEMIFNNCTGLEYVQLPQKLTTIPYAAFQYCVSLSNIEIPSTVTNITSSAFAYSGLTSITIPSGVSTIWSHVFLQCNNLQSVIIEGKITYIAMAAFNNCGSLKNIFYKGDASEWNNITMESGNGSLGKATIYFYSEDNPQTEGNYWYYENGKAVVW